MDSDIEFGDLTEAQPERKLRPDQDQHFAVVSCGQPKAGELPIFVDIDTMLDIERHALSDTSVELGGVMLGGQYEDDLGQPFVVIEDSLRAEHYHATKGSFKFTHETWEQITRERDKFSPDLEMVGWYHTHPDWGVFLSGMDLFICDNFFNRQLDVALVVDPCGDDRGWFQWVGANESKATKRTKGFYLIGSRFRKTEIEEFSRVLEGTAPMAIDPRQSQVAGYVGANQPIIQFADRGQNSNQLIMLGMLSLQFVFLAIVVVAMMLPQFSRQDRDSIREDQAEVLKRISQLEQGNSAELQAQAQQEVLEALSQQLSGNPKGMAIALEQTEIENQRLIESLDASIQKSRELNEMLAVTETKLSASERESANRGIAYNKLKSELEESQDKVDELEKVVGDEGLGVPFYLDWKAWLATLTFAILTGIGGFLLGRNVVENFDEDQETGEIISEPQPFSIDGDSKAGKSESGE